MRTRCVISCAIIRWLARLVLCLELLHHQHVVSIALDRKESGTLPAVGALVLGRGVEDLLPRGVVLNPVPDVYPGHAYSLLLPLMGPKRVCPFRQGYDAAS